MARSVQRIQMIEIDVPAGNTQTKFIFPDQPQLTGLQGLPVVIDSITSYSSESLPKSPLTFQDVIGADEISLAFLTIYQGDLAIVNACPLVDLMEVSRVGSATYGNVGTIKANNFRNLINVSWTKSFVQLANAPTGPTKIVFKVCYSVFENFEQVKEYLYNQQY